jgi:hypothetical protein
MHIDTFKQIYRQVIALEQAGIEFDVDIEGQVSWKKGNNTEYLAPKFYEVTTVSQLHKLQEVLGRPVKITGRRNQFGMLLENYVSLPVECTVGVKPLSSLVTTERSMAELRKEYPTVKFYSTAIKGETFFTPNLITEAPIEVMEKEETYRLVCSSKEMCDLCVPHTHFLYNYLDRGFMYAYVNRPNEKTKLVITNEMTPDTYLVMYLVATQLSFLKQLQNDCYLPSTQAKLLRAKFEKDLKEEFKPQYTRIKDRLLEDYQKSVNSNMVVKVINGQLPSATFNRIKLTKDTAAYEGVTLEAPGMLQFANDAIIFDDRTDIYVLIRGYIEAQLEKLEEMEIATPAEGEAEVEVFKDFRINGINVRVKRTSANTRRSVNGVNINKDELLEVCYRASCLYTQENFDKFVKSVGVMSLKWHDVLGNGLPVKIHDALTEDEYKSNSPPTTCPRIKFSKEEDNVYLITGDKPEDRAPIKLNLAIRKVNTLNRKINNRYDMSCGYTPKNAAWGRRELGRVLKECCTFEKKVLRADDEGVPILDNENRKCYDVVSECLLTDEKAKFIGKMAAEYYDLAVKRSSLFLADAVKKTGAVMVHFKGETCWKVEGNLNTYAVSQKTNQVFNYTTGSAICIVDPGHRVEVGFDSTACRLLALKNDSVRVNDIKTLARNNG